MPTVLVPAVEAALNTHDKIRLYYETSDDFAGVGAGAVLEDTMVGLDHLGRWERIVLVSDVEWIRIAVRAFGFLLPGRLSPSAVTWAARRAISSFAGSDDRPLG